MMNFFENLVAFRYLLTDHPRRPVLVGSLILLAVGMLLVTMTTGVSYFAGLAMAATGAFGSFLGLLLLFFNVYTSISIFGVFLGSAVLLVVLSVMGGLEDAQERQILGFSPHIIIRQRHYGDFKSRPEILEKIRSVANDFEKNASIYTFLDTEVLVKSTRYDAASGMILRGVDPVEDQGLEHQILEGTLSNITHPERVGWLDVTLAGASVYGDAPPVAPALCMSQDQGVVLGTSTLGSGVDVISPKGQLTPTGLMPRLKRFRVGCLFKTNDFRFDRVFAITSLREVQSFTGTSDTISGWFLKLKNRRDIEPAAAALRRVLPGDLVVDTWRTRNRALFNAMKLERIVMFLVLAVIILVAAFSITANLVMVVLDKKSEIAILKALGATDTMIMRTFMKQGIFIGLLGLSAGLATGMAICSYLAVVGLRMPRDVFQFAYLPVRLDWSEIVAVSAAALLLSLLATLYPARQAVKITPVEGLKLDDA